MDAINESDDESYCKYYFADLSEANNAVSANTTRIDLKETWMSFYCHAKQLKNQCNITTSKIDQSATTTTTAAINDIK